MFEQNRFRIFSSAAMLVVLIVSNGMIHAQSRHTANTLKLDDKTSVPTASIADLAWLAGHWSGSAYGGTCDEIWSPGAGGSMMGMFRLVKNNKPVFYELMTIVEENQTLVMKLKHFGPDLVGWEERTVAQSFPLVKFTTNEVFFSGLTYRKREDNSLQVFLATKQKSGEIVEEEFRFQPLGKPTANAEARVLLRTKALKINVSDMQKALTFYVGRLGFEIESRDDYPQRVTLKTDDRVKLILNRVEKLQNADVSDTQVGLTLQVNDLDQAIARLKFAGVEFADPQPRKEAVGNAISVRDPFGRKISLMHQTIVRVDPFKEPKIYNFGLLIPDMDSARNFYSSRLGFVVRSERYLPKDLPLGHKDKSFGFMLHWRPGVRSKTDHESRATAFYTIVFETDDLEKTVELLSDQGIKFVTVPAKDNKRRVVFFADPFGNISELVGPTLPK